MTQTNEVVEISASFYVSPVKIVSQDDRMGEDVAGGMDDAAEAVQDGDPDPPQNASALSRERAREQLHVIMGGDEGAYSSHNSFVALQFRTLDASIPARFIKAALAAADSTTP